MTVLPVIVRELRSQARQPLTYWLRVLAAGALLMTFAVAILAHESAAIAQSRATAIRGVSPFAHFGSLLFGYLNATIFICNCVLAPLLTADCISREKREGTLGLLFLTPLTAHGIVTGKAFAHMLRGVSLFMAVLPVMAVPVLLGGVSGKDCLMALLINTNVLVMGLAAGIFASACARDWMRAVVFALILSIGLVMLFMYVHVVLLDKLSIVPNLFLSGSLASQWAELFYLHTNLAVQIPGRSLGAAPWSSAWSMMWSITARAGTGWFSLVAAILVAALLFLSLVVLMAAGRVRRSWRQEPSHRRISELQRSLTRPRFAVPVLRRLLSRSLDRNPIGWLQHYAWGGRITRWGWLAVIMVIESLLVADVWNFAEFQTWAVLLLVVGIAFTAAASFRKERESGVLELLLVCPLSVAQIVGGRLRGIWMQFLPSAALLTLCLVVGAQIEAYNILTELGAVMFCALIAVAIIGLYFSLYRVHFLVAWLLTILFGIIIPFLVSVSAMFLLEIENLIFGLISTAFVFAILFWCLLHHRLESRRFLSAHA
jgi:ABC-type transport system involved in multi-copper enzyme maturation permease subunit